MTRVMSPGSRPTTGAERTPTSPASPMLTAQTPMEIRSGLVAESDVMAGESTMARTRSPMSVNRRTTTPATTTRATQMYVMTCSIVTATPRKSNTRTGSGARPGADRIVWLPKISAAAGGMATEMPMVATTLISGRASRSLLNKKKYSPMPRAGPATTIVTSAAGTMAQCSWVLR